MQVYGRLWICFVGSGKSWTTWSHDCSDSIWVASVHQDWKMMLYELFWLNHDWVQDDVHLYGAHQNLFCGPNRIGRYDRSIVTIIDRQPLFHGSRGDHQTGVEETEVYDRLNKNCLGLAIMYSARWTNHQSRIVWVSHRTIFLESWFGKLTFTFLTVFETCGTWWTTFYR